MREFKSGLARLEARLQSLIEGSAARLFSSAEVQRSLAQSLTAAMQAGLKTRPDGQVLAPNLYVLSLHPVQAQLLQADRSLLESLRQTLQDSGAEEGIKFMDPPVIRVVSDPDLPPQGIQVDAQLSTQDKLADTSTMHVDAEIGEHSIPANAFLIVNGTEMVNLTRPVINIGRRSDNHLVIDDPRISRVHAQLRAVKGRYVIFDLDSTGGTFVNQQPIHQAVLYSGDVISLAGVPLVFGQEGPDGSQTQPLIIG